MGVPGITRGITVLLATSVLLLGVPAAPASASAATSGTGWIRLAHLSPATPAVDVYLYSFGNSSAHVVLRHVGYGTVSPYEAVTAGDYSVAMRAAGAPPGSQPVLSASVTIAAGHAYTVAAVGPRSGLRLQVLGDDLTTPPGKALVRVIQASLRQPVVKVSWDGKVIASQLPFASVTSYQAVSPGTETLTQAPHSPPAAYTRWLFSTGPTVLRSPTSRTRREAVSRPRVVSGPDSAVPRHTGQAHRCRGWWSSQPGRCLPWPAG